MRKALLVTAAISALANAGALAQNTTKDSPANALEPAPSVGANPSAMTPANTPQAAAQPVPKDGPSFVQVQSTDMLSSNVVELDIYNSQNDDIGKIKDVAFDASKQVTGYILFGRWLPWNGHALWRGNPGALMVSYDPQSKTWKATMNATKEQLKSAPEFKYDGQWTASKS